MYIIKVRAYIDGRRVDGEYDGGRSLPEARAESAKFSGWAASDPCHTVKICTSDRDGNLRVVETTSEGGQFHSKRGDS
jgi:hypothetical protein